MTGGLDHATLKRKQRALRDGFPAPAALRIHRAISWIGRAEACGEDHDARFIFLWIAFNAAYADEEMFQNVQPSARAAFGSYFRRIVALDHDRRIYDALWRQFSGPVRLLMQNRYVFHAFWQHHNGIPGNENWQAQFVESARRFRDAFRAGDCARVLEIVFDRLYVLRNQLVHGGATWNSSVNRDQVRDGARILGFLMPVFIDIMMDNPAADWGRPFYPVVSDDAADRPAR
ncbi:MAG: hypothetical protein D6686_06180 [Alphaproteobacteria bacterium]|nr:MAG: hypothetical protein D6686_06180 [Alphaproteobacteria bacterium]